MPAQPMLSKLHSLLLLCAYVGYFERWLFKMMVAVNKSEAPQELRIVFLHPQNWPFSDLTQLHPPRLFHGGKTPAGGLNVDSKGGGPQTGKLGELGWEESAGRGKLSPQLVIQQAKHRMTNSPFCQVIFFLPEKFRSKIGLRGCTQYEFAHILKTVIFYLFLAPHCQMFSERTSSL